MADIKLATIGDLSGLVALVTGGGTGLGLMMARGLAAHGAKVYITGRREGKLTEAVAKFGDGRFVALPMDIVSKESISSGVQVIQEAEGKLDILINNAGVTGPFSEFISDRSAPENKTLGASLFQAQSFEQWENTFASNTAAPFFVTTAFLDLLQKGAAARDGETSSVINITSSFGHTNLSMNGFAYGITKVATEQLTRTLATEFALNNIPVRVNGIAPGTFATDMTAPSEYWAEAAKNPIPGSLLPAPVLRVGRESELVMTALYLASPGGGYTNGHTILMDGGWAAVNP